MVGKCYTLDVLVFEFCRKSMLIFLKVWYQKKYCWISNAVFIVSKAFLLWCVNLLHVFLISHVMKHYDIICWCSEATGCRPDGRLNQILSPISSSTWDALEVFISSLLMIKIPPKRPVQLCQMKDCDIETLQFNYLPLSGVTNWQKWHFLSTEVQSAERCNVVFEPL